MEAFRIAGGARLAGGVRVPGAKNSVLKLMAAGLLAEGTTTLVDVPDILDVRIMAELLRRLGCDVAYETGRGAVTLAVCGGYQLLGHSYQLGDERIPGLGLADLETVREDGPRLIGNVAIEVDLGTGPRVLAGFENHGGRTRLGPGVRPLARVRHGYGNNGEDGHEGAVYKNAIGTYVHGSLLPKNPTLADHVLTLALSRRYPDIELAPIDDRAEERAHAAALCLR